MPTAAYVAGSHEIANSIVTMEASDADKEITTVTGAACS